MGSKKSKPVGEYRIMKNGLNEFKVEGKSSGTRGMHWVQVGDTFKSEDEAAQFITVTKERIAKEEDEREKREDWQEVKHVKADK